MHWILDNLNVLLFIGAGIAFWLNSQRQAREEARQEREEPPVDLEEIFGPDFDFGSPKQTEVFLPPPVTGAAPPPLPGQVVAAPAAARERRAFPGANPTPQRPQSPHQPAEAITAELERQRSLEQRIHSLRQQREQRGSGAAATKRSVAASRAARRGEVEASPPTELKGIRSRLRSPGEARRAIVLREILGTPVGLQ